MTSMPCSFHLQYPHCSSSSCLQKLRKPFFGGNRNGVLGSFRPQRIGLRIVPTPYSRAKCWFRFGKNGVDAEGAGIYGSQTRDDFDRDDVEQVLLLFFLDCLFVHGLFFFSRYGCFWSFSLAGRSVKMGPCFSDPDRLLGGAHRGGNWVGNISAWLNISCHLNCRDCPKFHTLNGVIKTVGLSMCYKIEVDSHVIDLMVCIELQLKWDLCWSLCRFVYDKIGFDHTKVTHTG